MVGVSDGAVNDAPGQQRGDDARHRRQEGEDHHRGEPAEIRAHVRAGLPQVRKPISVRRGWCESQFARQCVGVKSANLVADPGLGGLGAVF